MAGRGGFDGSEPFSVYGMSFSVYGMPFSVQAMSFNSPLSQSEVTAVDRIVTAFETCSGLQK